MKQIGIPSCFGTSTVGSGLGGVIIQERSKALLLVHSDTEASRSAIQALILRNTQLFEQESMLWETSSICAVF